MGFRIRSNTGSAFSAYQLQKSQQEMSASLQRFSSGQKINKAADDAAGMVIANRLAGQANGYGQAIRNASDAISIVQIADGALGQAADLIQGIREKAIQAASDLQSPQSRQAIQMDINQSLETLKNISDQTSFNGQQLLSGAFSNRQFQVGAESGQTIDISLGSVDPATIADIDSRAISTIDVTTPEGAQKAIELTDHALDFISQERARVGSYHQQLESTINNLSNTRINTIAAESQIRDLDYAEESITLNKIKLLSKARSFALAQANKTAGRIIDVLE